MNTWPRFIYGFKCFFSRALFPSRALFLSCAIFAYPSPSFCISHFTIKCSFIWPNSGTQITIFLLLLLLLLMIFISNDIIKFVYAQVIRYREGACIQNYFANVMCVIYEFWTIFSGLYMNVFFWCCFVWYCATMPIVTV